MKNIIRTIISILTPIIIIILGFIACAKAASLPEHQLHLLYYSPYVILAVVMVLSYKFSRSRAFFIGFLIIIFLLLKLFQEKIPVSAEAIYIIISILLPFNLFVFAVLKERGIISLWGMLRFGFMIPQAGLAYWILSQNPQRILPLLHKAIIPMPINPYLSLPQSALLVFILAFLVLLIRFILYRADQDIVLLSVLVALFLMLNGNKVPEYPVFAAVIGLLLILSVLKDTYFMAFYDELTGLPSRRALNQDMMKLGMRYSIAMLDIDFFKKFNDSYGHDTGDEVLQFVAAIIKKVKAGGKAYRYGGEEFTLLFPGKNLTEVMPVLEELKGEIAGKGFVIRRKRRAKSSTKRSTKRKVQRRNSNSANRKKVYIHVSIGAAGKDDTNKAPTLVLKAADSALYRAKKKGRNCVSK